MRFVQQDKKEEVPSLPVWLGRDVPHERELTRELLDKIGREKSLDYLLRLHDTEETRRQKIIAYCTAIILFFFVISLLLSISILCHLGGERREQSAWMHMVMPLMMLCTLPIHLYNLWTHKSRRRKTPLFSSVVQQNVITALLDYADSPLVADALARATTYYAGDKSRLFYRLAHVLPLLPDDADALTKPARHALLSYTSALVAIAADKATRRQGKPPRSSNRR